MPDCAPFPPGTYPFWFWNDQLDHDELRLQVAEMAAKGFRGFYIHSRQGLRTPYLSDAFFQCVETVIDAAREHGMYAQLYDEYPYPSGIAGGEVVLGNPQYMATYLLQQTHRVEGGVVELDFPAGEILDCQAFPLHADGRADCTRGRCLRRHIGMLMRNNSFVETGLTAYNRKRYFASDPCPVLQVELPPEPHLIVVSIQTLVTNHKYWGYFVDVMNAAAVQRWLYLTHQRYADRLGKAIGENVGSIFVDETTPSWSALLPAFYEEEYGENLPPLLPALVLPEHPRHLDLQMRYRDLKLEIFTRAFERPVSDWCHQHGIRYVGEKNSLRLSQLQHLDIPGCEPGHTKAGAPPDYHAAKVRGNARATASAAWFYGKEGALCECFHSLGWSGTMQDARVIAEGLVQQGIRYLVPHGVFYSTHALRKHDAPPSFYMQMPYWPLYGMLQARTQRIFDFLGDAWMHADIAILDPNGGLVDSDRMEIFQQLLHRLVAAHHDYHIVDIDMLAEAVISEGRVHLRGVAPCAVILPPMRTVETRLAQWLETDGAQGVALRINSSDDIDTTLATLATLTPPSLRIDGAGSDGLQCTTWFDGTTRRWVLLNVTDQQLQVTLRSDRPIREVKLDELLPPRLAADGSRTIAPFESLLIEEGEAPEAAPLPELRLSIANGQPCSFTIDRRNLVRLDAWGFSLDDSAGAGPVRAMPLANQLAESRHPFVPNWEVHFGQMPDMRLPTLLVTYTATFRYACDSQVELVMEPDSICGDWRLRINSGEWCGPEAFRPSAAHVRGSLGCNITQDLTPGENQIIVELTTDRLDGGLLNPLYLAGDFAVNVETTTLHPARTRGGFEAWRDNGLPYFSGIIDYKLQASVETVPSAPELLVWLDLPAGFEEACELSINGQSWLPLPWSPRGAQIPAHWLKAGTNELHLRVYTTLIRSFEGDFFNRSAHAYRKV